MVNYKVINKDKMKGTLKLAGECLHSLLENEVETGYVIGVSDYLLFYIYDKDGVNYSKYTIEYDESKDEVYYCKEVIDEILNGTCDYFKPSFEQQYIQNLIADYESENLVVMENQLYDIKNSISINLDSLDVMKFDRIGCSLILIDQDGYKFEADFCQDKLFEIEDEK